MMPEVETHHHHAHATGHRRLDMVLPISALFVSIISLVLAVIHGRAMERMADANARLVQANSWPFLQYDTSNATPAGETQMQLKVVNNGVGPAKIETFEVFWKGQPVGNARELLNRCCGLQPGDLPRALGLQGSPAEQIARARHAAQASLIVGTVRGRVLEPRETITFLRLPFTARDEHVFKALYDNTDGVSVRACYCSVFDECWLSDLETMKPATVAQCPTPKVTYNN